MGAEKDAGGVEELEAEVVSVEAFGRKNGGLLGGRRRVSEGG